MKILSHSVLWSSLAAVAILSSGCGSDSSSDVPSEVKTRSVAIDFQAMMGEEAAVCSENNQTKTYATIGSNADKVSFTDFRFFVSEVAMVKADGSKVPLSLENNDFQYQASNGDHVALMDFEDNTGDCVDRGNTAAKNTKIVGTVAEGDYTGLAFTLGVPFEINHDKESYVDVVALNQPMMSWNWQAGRKFTKIEIKSENNASLIWNFHLGSTGCVASEDNSTVVTANCAQPNRVEVMFSGFDPQTSMVKVDYKSLLMNNNVGADMGGAKGCMSSLTDPECEMMLTGLALDFANKTGECVNGGDCSSQQLFYTMPK